MISGIIALAVVVLVLIGYFSPGSIPGKFVWGTLNLLGVAGDNYKAKHSVANYRAAVVRTSKQLGRGAESAGGYEALIASRTREKGELMDEADQLEADLDQLDLEGVPDTDEQKVRKGQRLMELQTRLAKVDEDLKRYGSTQANTIRMLREQKQRVVQGRRRSQELEVDLRASETEAQLAGQQAAFDPDSGHDTMAEAERMVQEQVDKNRGRAHVLQEVMGESREDRDLHDRVSARKAADYLAARRARKQPKITEQ